MIKLAVILPAAGTGSRMRSETPKPYLRLKGTTILEHTIRNFLRVDGLVQIVIATSNPWMSQGNSIASSFKRPLLTLMFFFVKILKLLPLTFLSMSFIE